MAPDVQRTPYVGICFNELHSKLLNDRIVEMVIDGMRDDQSTFYQANFADLLTKTKGTKRADPPCGTPAPKKKPKTSGTEPKKATGKTGKKEPKTKPEQATAKPKKRSKADLMAMLETLRNKKQDAEDEDEDEDAEEEESEPEDSGDDK